MACGCTKVKKRNQWCVDDASEAGRTCFTGYAQARAYSRENGLGRPYAVPLTD